MEDDFNVLKDVINLNSLPSYKATFSCDMSQLQDATTYIRVISYKQRRTHKKKRINKKWLKKYGKKIVIEFEKQV